MDFKLFSDSQLVLVENNGKYTLYHMDCDDETHIRMTQLVVAATDSAPRVEVGLGLIFTSNGVYDFEGKKVSDFSHTKFAVHKMHGEDNFLIVDAACSEILLLNGSKIVLNAAAKAVKRSKRYVAFMGNGEWQLYRYNGLKLSFAAPIPEDNKLFLGDSLVVCGTPGNYRLYSLYDKEVLCEKQNHIHCSPTQHFAICSELTGKKANIFYNGYWKSFDNVEEFTIVNDTHRLFALRCNGKNFVYNYDGTPDCDLAKLYPNGMDFVSFNDGLLKVMDNGNTNFYSRG